jgi:hypothetical protein
MSSSIKKKPFSRFKLDEAYQLLKLTTLEPWPIVAPSLVPSDFLNSLLTRLQSGFDIQRSEEGRKLIIDSILLEVIHNFPQLKIWKGPKLEGETATGAADYLITAKRDYVATPFLCVAEAKKDDFEQGLAQCLVEMKACQWNNLSRNDDRDRIHPIDIFGIVTNAEGWKFYKLTTQNQVYETELYAFRNLPDVLGILTVLLTDCDRYLKRDAP